MFFSSRHIQQMRDSLLAISFGEWFFLACGLILGACLWLLINRKIVQKVVAALQVHGAKPDPTAFCESAMGFAILLINGGLLYLATLLPSYFLLSFAITGLLVGTWITMPADSP